MTPFAYAAVHDVSEAIACADEGSMFLAGGTEALNWLRLGIENPKRVVDLSRIAGLDRIEPRGDGLRLGALARLSDVCAHQIVRRDYPVLAQATEKSASAQLRNLATIGGNLLQRTRCAYFRAEEALPCNKRVAGSGCAARHGINDRHAIFGWTDACVATQPSDPAVALAALDAVVVVQGRAGERRVPVRDFHTLPTDDPTLHNGLRRDECITAIDIGSASPHSAYVKVRERESYEFALVSAAATLDLDAGVIRSARIALGSVAMRPWRLDATERALVGARPGGDDIARAIDMSLQEARALEHNAYKIPLARNAALRAITLAMEQAS